MANSVQSGANPAPFCSAFLYSGHSAKSNLTSAGAIGLSTLLCLASLPPLSAVIASATLAIGILSIRWLVSTEGTFAEKVSQLCNGFFGNCGNCSSPPLGNSHQGPPTSGYNVPSFLPSNSGNGRRAEVGTRAPVGAPAPPPLPQKPSHLLSPRASHLLSPRAQGRQLPLPSAPPWEDSLADQQRREQELVRARGTFCAGGPHSSYAAAAAHNPNRAQVGGRPTAAPTPEPSASGGQDPDRGRHILHLPTYSEAMRTEHDENGPNRPLRAPVGPRS